MSRLFEDEDLLSALDNRADDATTRKMLEDPSFVDALNRARDFLETGEDPLFLRVRGTSLRIASGLVEAARIKGGAGPAGGAAREPRSHGGTERDTEVPLMPAGSVERSVTELGRVAPTPPSLERARVADETMPHGVAVGARKLGATHVNGIVLGAGVVLGCFVVAMLLLAVLHRSSPAADGSASAASGAPAPSVSSGTPSGATAVTAAVPSAATSTPSPSPSLRTTASAEPPESASAPLLPPTRPPPPPPPPASTSAAPPPPPATSTAPATTTTSSIRIID
ncbi:MAG: hypothetical protein HY908_27220 [Myxococcales bacterium]|nr:hypothetical protein [Myxococcales bacterium]